MTRIENVSADEARAYLILHEVGWSKRRIGRVFGREAHAVCDHIARQEYELRAARQLRMTQAIRL